MNDETTAYWKWLNSKDKGAEDFPVRTITSSFEFSIPKPPPRSRRGIPDSI